MSTNYLDLPQGILFVILGFILLTRKKFMIKKEYDILVSSFIMIAIFSGSIDTQPPGPPYALIIFAPIALILIKMENGSYSLYNVDEKALHNTLANILKEKSIDYVEKGNSLILKSYHCKSISYKKQTRDSTTINLKNIRDLPLYEDIKQELRVGIEKIEDVVFPITGITLMALGIAIIVLM